MKILLTTLNAKYIHTNLAIRLLYEMNHEFEGLAWKEFTIKESQDEIAEECSAYDIIAFSCYIWNITPTLAVIKRIKSINPQIKIILGGPEVSYEWQNVIALPEIDFIIVGEGEIPFKTFIHSFPSIENVPGLVWKEGEKIRQNPVPANFDLNELASSMPYRFDKPEDLKNKVLYLETSRGCPYKCEFCLASLDNKVRHLPMETIKNTLLFMMQHGKVVKFLDRTFNIKKDFTLEIFQFILDHHQPGNVFQFEITADILHPAIILFINEKVPQGLFRFEVGIQTVNQKANLAVSRKQSFEKTKGVIKSVESKVEMHLDLIVGLPFDHWEDIKMSIEEVFKLHPPELQLGFLKFLKGTPVREKYAEHGFEFDPLPPYQIIRSNFLSQEELAKIVLLEHALEIYWNGKKSINTLKYVTEKYNIFDFLSGLGETFATKNDLHHYKLTDVFEALTTYANEAFPDDEILSELIAVDYFLHFKVKPKSLFIGELEKKEKNKLIDNLKLNHHKFRFAVLPLHFDFNRFQTENKIIPLNKNLIIQYNGISKPEVVNF